MSKRTPGPWVADGFFEEHENATRVALPDHNGSPNNIWSDNNEI